MFYKSLAIGINVCSFNDEKQVLITILRNGFTFAFLSSKSQCFNAIIRLLLLQFVLCKYIDV